MRLLVPITAVTHVPRSRPGPRRARSCCGTRCTTACPSTPTRIPGNSEAPARRAAGAARPGDPRLNKAAGLDPAVLSRVLLVSLRRKGWRSGGWPPAAAGPGVPSPPRGGGSAERGCRLSPSPRILSPPRRLPPHTLPPADCPRMPAAFGAAAGWRCAAEPRARRRAAIRGSALGQPAIFLSALLSPPLPGRAGRRKAGRRIEPIGARPPMSAIDLLRARRAGAEGAGAAIAVLSVRRGDAAGRRRAGNGGRGESRGAPAPRHGPWGARARRGPDARFREVLAADAGSG